jgi:hypothetical protein
MWTKSKGPGNSESNKILQSMPCSFVVERRIPPLFCIVDIGQWSKENVVFSRALSNQVTDTEDDQQILTILKVTEYATYF